MIPAKGVPAKNIPAHGNKPLSDVVQAVVTSKKPKAKKVEE